MKFRLRKHFQKQEYFFFMNQTRLDRTLFFFRSAETTPWQPSQKVLVLALHGELDGRVGDEHEGSFGAVPECGNSLLHPDLT